MMAAGQTCPFPPRRAGGSPLAEFPRARLSLRSIPSFAPIAIQLLNVVSQENAGLDKLAALIRSDPGMSVELVRLANSPLFGARREITGILHALAMLGLNRVKSMVMTVAIRDFLSPARFSGVFAPCWRHSLATAFLAEEIAGHGSQDRDSSYTAGLIHELGRLGLIAAQPEKYDLIVRISQEEGTPLADLERTWFGMDHEQLGVRLLDEWKLPAYFRPVLDRRAEPAGVVPVVRTACALAGMTGFCTGGGAEDWDPARLGALPPAMLKRLPEEMGELAAAVATKINAVECSLVMV